VSALAVGTMPGNDQVLASGGLDATVRLWRLDSGQELAVFRGHADQYEEGWTTRWAGRAINALAFTAWCRPAATAPCASGISRRSRNSARR
jgi:WD40 repeat protein